MPGSGLFLKGCQALINPISLSWINVKILLVVNDSPWGSTLAATALRVAQAILQAGHDLQAVFFREEGVYNAISGTLADGGLPEAAQAWSDVAEQAGTALLLCQSSVQRRLETTPGEPFRETGLVAFLDQLESCDRVVTF